MTRFPILALLALLALAACGADGEPLRPEDARRVPVAGTIGAGGGL